MSKKEVYVKSGESVMQAAELSGNGAIRFSIRTRFMGQQEGVVYLDAQQVDALREFLNDEEGKDGKQG